MGLATTPREKHTRFEEEMERLFEISANICAESNCQ
jgi:hypothetical protein